MRRHLQGGIDADVAQTPGAEARGHDALVVQERVALCQRLAVEVQLAVALPAGGIVEPLIAREGELAKQVRILEMLLDAAVDMS